MSETAQAGSKRATGQEPRAVNVTGLNSPHCLELQGDAGSPGH